MSEFRTAFLPYCLQRQPDGRWIVLNRNYKPLGTLSPEWVDYATHPSLIKLNLTTASLQALSAEGSTPTPDCVWLYTDACVPTDSAAAWKAYADRLHRLAQLKLV